MKIQPQTPSQSGTSWYLWFCIVALCIYALQACHFQGPSPASKSNDLSTKTITIAIKDSFAAPVLHPISSVNPPKIVKAGKPVIVVDSSNGGNPFFTRFDMEEGLPLNSVFCSAADRSGNIWFGTIGGGVSRYDGKSFTNYTIAQGLIGNVVTSVIEDKEGNLWFGTSSGVSKYDGYRFTNFSTIEGLAGNYISCIMQDAHGDIWFGSQEGGVSKYDGKSFSNYSMKQGMADNYIHCMLQDRDGVIWFGTGAGGVSRFDGDSFKSYKTEQGLISNAVNSIAQDESGNLWFGTNGGLSKYDGSIFMNYGSAQGLADDAVSCIAQDRTGILWIGTYSKGISKFDGTRFTNYTKAQGLADNNITSILQDGTGTLWFTTHGGVSKYEGNSVTSFNSENGLAGNMLFKIIQDRNRDLWFGTYEGGVSKFDGSRFMNYSKKEGLPDVLIWNTMMDREGNIWFGTDKGGLSKFDGKSFTNYTTQQGLPNNTVNSIFQDAAGNIWVGTHGGVSRFDGNSFTNYNLEQGLVGSNVMQIVQDKSGNFWFATHDDGVSKFDGYHFTGFTTEQGLISNKVYSMIQDKDENIWIGTNAGVSKYDGKAFTNYTTEQGLADNYIWAMVEDRKRGLIWLGTNQGLSVIKGNDSTGEYHKEYVYENFNKSTGYPIKEVNSNSLFVDDRGIVWIGSGHKELIRFDYSAIHRNEEALNLCIQGVRVNNEPVCWNNLLGKIQAKGPDSLTILNEMIYSFGKVLSPAVLDSMGRRYAGIELDSVTRFYPVPVNLVLPDEFNSITIDFVAIEPALQKQVKYQYKMEGYNKDWSPLSNNSTAVFGNMKAGEYVLKLKAVSPFGVWSETEYSFKVLPPWWATWWAYTIYAIFIGGLGYVLYRNRIQGLKNKQAEQIKAMVATQEGERKRISRDLHDDVGTKLSALKLFISALQEKAELTNNDDIKSLAVSSEQFITEAVKDVRLLLQNLSPAILEEFGYITAVEGLVHRLNESGQIHVELVNFGMIGGLHKEYDLALYRITQELINNVLKHSKAKNVSLQIGQRDGKIILMIEDDGVGFDVGRNREGYGLQNLEARTKLLNGEITIDSHPGTGTSVLIEIPANSNKA